MILNKTSKIVIIVVSILIVCIIIGIIIYEIIKHRKVSQPTTQAPKTQAPKTQAPTTQAPLIQQTPESSIVISYLNALYPQNTNFNSILPAKILQLYDSLMWYYIPLVRDIDKSRTAPLKGPYKDAECQWFMADGTDCGDYQATPGKFTCSVFGGKCASSEFGDATSGGKPYQSIAFIKPYGMRNGSPSNAYIECVAFVCEALGRMLLTPKCQLNAPNWADFISARQKVIENFDTSLILDSDTNKACTFPDQKTSCDEPKQQNPGCVIGSADMPDVCCWDYTNNKADDSVCPFPAKCMATQDVGKPTVYGNYCSVPCGYVGCDESTNCNWYIGTQKWEDALKKYTQGSVKVADFIKNSIPNISNDDNIKAVAPPRNDPSVQKTMFYWCKGYGKFLDMGKTGVYFSYTHFLLTCPKYAKDGKTPIRWSYPQILQTATSGNSSMIKQLEALIGDGKTKDKRKYLEGYVTTLRDGYDGSNEKYEAPGEVNNKILYSTENVGGLINPLDDSNLNIVNNVTITKYYDPGSNIQNPQYDKIIKNTPLNAVYLQQGMIINGATCSSREFPFVNLTHSKMGNVDGSGTWPFGVFFKGSALGGCVYKMISMLGWKSAQFTQMPTGAGGVKYCNSPEYDYEIVYIADKNAVCKTEMKMLNPIIDLENYINNGFIDGNKYNPNQLNAVSFDATKMSLTERNVPTDWGKTMPNAMLYKQPTPSVQYKSQCPYKDDVYSRS